MSCQRHVTRGHLLRKGVALLPLIGLMIEPPLAAAQTAAGQTTAAPSTATSTSPAPAASPPPPIVTVPPPVTPSPTAAAPAAAKTGSRHLRCDGLPVEMSGAEAMARLVGAITLLGLLAPRHEQPDPSQREFAAAGIAVCSELIDGPKAEPNRLRRLPLILARAIHRIEAKDFAGAITDAQYARSEAKAIGMIGNAYFDRSFGLSIDLIEARARLRANDFAGARDVGLTSASRQPYSIVTQLMAADFAWANRDASPTEDAYRNVHDRVWVIGASSHATRLAELGRFGEAATLYDAIETMLDNLDTETPAIWPWSSGALAYALTGDFTKAQDRADRARQALDSVDAAGKPFGNRADVISQLDLYAVLRTAHDGKVADARRTFAARSEWTGINNGLLGAAIHLLRAGAHPEELTGALAKSEDELWQANFNRVMAAVIKADADNKTLFNFILPYAPVDDYEHVSRNVWRHHNNLVGAKPLNNSKFYSINVAGLQPAPLTRSDVMLLSTALEAKSRGFKGFVYLGLPNTPWAAMVMFGNAGEPAMPAPFYLDADAVIADLRQIIPSPEDIEARDKAKKPASGS